MKTANTTSLAVACDRFGAAHENTPCGPDASAIMGRLRKAMTEAAEWVIGADPEVVRTRFLSQATDPADLERRVDVWERAQETRRALPLVL